MSRLNTLFLRQGTSRAGVRAVLYGTLHNVHFFFAARPKTPLRVLCIMAFDVLHLLRHDRPISRDRRKTLALLLDYGAALNTVHDGKPAQNDELQTTRILLENAGLQAPLHEYTRRLALLESDRPSPGGDAARFHAVQAYRESVVRLSLGMVAFAAGLHGSLHQGIDASTSDPDLNLLFRIVMLCQIMDDVGDYAIDHSANLPSFLTADKSLDDSLSMTRRAARHYATLSGTSCSAAAPLRMALALTSACNEVSIFLWDALGRRAARV